MSKISMTEKVKGHIGFHYFIDRNAAVYFDSFGIEYIPQDVLNNIKDKSITIFFIEYMIAGKTLLGCTFVFPNVYQNNG